MNLHLIPVQQPLRVDRRGVDIETPSFDMALETGGAGALSGVAAVGLDVSGVVALAARRLR